MATGGVPIVRNSASEPRVRGPGNGAPSRGSRQPTSVDDIFRFNWIGDKDEDKPNNYVSWFISFWDFCKNLSFQKLQASEDVD